jgi:ABC-type nickel/cobalt efflux system permease component RcnA
VCKCILNVYNRVNPIYFVCFTTATIIASAILFHGFNTDNPINVASLICGFIIIFTGVYLLDSIARNENSQHHLHGDLSSSDEAEDDDMRYLMGNDEDDEAALLDQHDNNVHSTLNLSGLNHDSDEDIELVLRPRSAAV